MIGWANPGITGHIETAALSPGGNVGGAQGRYDAGMKRRAIPALLALASACASVSDGEVRIAHLGRAGGDARAFDALRSEFARRNPGYEMALRAGCLGVPGEPRPRVLFVQTGEARAEIRSGDGSLADSSALGVGDVVLLRPHQTLSCESPLTLLAFTVPEPIPEGLPSFVRPDWDPRITDTPGGCATETGAYRRILLTWLESNGPYVYRALNAHRVRITDSFSHYHPIEGGFDELYLVQMARPGARIVTSEEVEWIERPLEVDRGRARGLLKARPLEPGDLVYLPRGTMHRGSGGALVQVITVPGFRPGAEIGVDHHLRAIAERTGVPLPYHTQASRTAVVR